jgi:hypothetical protein
MAARRRGVRRSPAPFSCQRDTSFASRGGSQERSIAHENQAAVRQLRLEHFDGKKRDESAHGTHSKRDFAAAGVRSSS